MRHYLAGFARAHNILLFADDARSGSLEDFLKGDAWIQQEEAIIEIRNRAVTDYLIREGEKENQRFIAESKRRLTSHF